LKNIVSFGLKKISSIYKYYSEYSTPSNISQDIAIPHQKNKPFKTVRIAGANNTIIFGSGYCEGCNIGECRDHKIQSGIKLKFNSRLKRFFRNKKVIKYIKSN